MTWRSKSNRAGRRSSLAAFFFAFVVGALPGCSGNSEPARIPGSGHVDLNGLGVSDFSISYFPAEGLSGPVAATTIKEGEYTFTAQTGPAMPGPYRVVIEEPVVPISRVERRNGAVKKEKPRQWEFQYKVPENGPFSRDFDLN